MLEQLGSHAMEDGSPVQGHRGHNAYSQLQEQSYHDRPRSFHTVQTALTSPPPLSLQCDGILANSASPFTPSPASPVGASRQRDYLFTSRPESGSPTKQRSPLRQSLTFTEPPELSPGPDPTSVEMSYTGDKKKPANSPRDRGLPWRSPSMSESQDQPAGSPDTTPTRPAKFPGGSRTPNSKPSSPAGSSRFAFFASSMAAFKGRSTSNPVMVPQDDELISMDIESALYPGGAEANSNTFSPAAYKNLQMTAKGLLERFQSAYQQKTIDYQELKAEHAVQDDEKEEAETRMHHLRIQLEGMAQKAAEQESAMQALMDELAIEKRLRREERQARENCTSVSGESTPSEDLGVEEDQKHRQWRRSVCTAKSDMSFETDEESIEGASVFSRSRSPTIVTTVTELSHVDQALPPPTRSPASPALRVVRQPPTPQATQMNTFQKLFKGISGDANFTTSVASCRNCAGQDASVAWDTVTLLKDENKGLKERVGELESAVEGALDIVQGFGIKGLATQG
ncbi:unnamed protein product [Clonostachys rosea f. rosea IK726]|uniref:Uncharacterized protein n=1 Tax=Clonostachys rosea f. rosea IK726 TaxID=1349383 RepID=A0ACA9TVP4_BIOOC|nr:unnamed protein product [Clonostachys rosea f. rosea IK726]